jgi:hypothetical protein
MVWAPAGPLTLRCRACDTAYYCSAACERAHAETLHRPALCAAARRLHGHRADPHTKSLMALALAVLAHAALDADDDDEHNKKSRGGAGGEGSILLVPAYADVLLLQSHADALSADELCDWQYVRGLGPWPDRVRLTGGWGCTQQERWFPGAGAAGRGPAVGVAIGAALPVGP